MWDHHGGQKTTTKVWCWDGGSVQQNKAQPAAEFGAQWDPQENFVKMKGIWDLEEELEYYKS